MRKCGGKNHRSSSLKLTENTLASDCVDRMVSDGWEGDARTGDA